MMRDCRCYGGTFSGCYVNHVKTGLPSDNNSICITISPLTVGCGGVCASLYAVAVILN